MLALAAPLAISPLPLEAQARRTLERFTRGRPENGICWDRDGIDGFISVIDAHQHPMPFGGPEVPFSVYTDWFIQHGVVFSVFMGIGQTIMKQNASLPDCCYYLHCPTYEYPVIPSTLRDEMNAEARLAHYYGKVEKRLKLILSATFPNLQRSVGAKQSMLALWAKFPETFTWTGEINVFKHALAGNGFFSDFTGPRLTVQRVESGELDEFFSIIGPRQPNGEHVPAATLHSDMGCDTYENSIPKHRGDGVHPIVCECLDEEKLVAQHDAWWWKRALGGFYSGFFDAHDYPKPNFRKIMHLHVLDAIVSRYKEVKFVWAHLGLSMELQTLHPAVHAQVLRSFYERHATNLWSDLSWDVLAKLNFVNFDGQPIEAAYAAAVHEDLADDALWDAAAVTAERERLELIWQAKKGGIKGTMTTLTGPSYKMAVLLTLLHAYPERAITGTDYVASFGTHEEYPGFTPLTGAPLSPAAGCKKTEQSHAEQLTDTSSLNMFFDDETFAAVVLGGNFFRVAGISTTFAPPPLCRHDDLPLPLELVTTATGRRNGAVGRDEPTQNSLLALIIAAGISGLVAGSGGAYWLLRRRKKDVAAVALQGGDVPLIEACRAPEPGRTRVSGDVATFFM